MPDKTPPESFSEETIEFFQKMKQVLFEMQKDMVEQGFRFTEDGVYDPNGTMIKDHKNNISDRGGQVHPKEKK